MISILLTDLPTILRIHTYSLNLSERKKTRGHAGRLTGNDIQPLTKMADEAEKNELIAQFTSVTGADPQRAQFYLESSAWQLQVPI